MRRIANPIATKVGPSMKTDELIQLINTLNPKKRSRRLTLISRMGSDKVRIAAPLVRAVKKEG